VDNLAIRQAVRRLRVALGDTQQQFANRLKLAISTVVRYELSRAPRGKALAQLERVAREHRLDECAAVFRDALLEELELDLRSVQVLPVTPFVRLEGLIPAKPETSDEKDLVTAVLYVKRQAEGPGGRLREKAKKEMNLILRAIQRIRESAQSAQAANEVAVDRAEAIVRLHREGMSPEEIATKFNLTKESVEAIVSEFEEGQRNG
jgi:transposase